MKMKRYTGTVSTDKIRSDCTFWFEMPEDATQEEIEEEAYSLAMGFVEWNYKEAE